MRLLTFNEKAKRGCYYCTDLTVKNGRKACPYYECPYHELDEFENYGEYLKSKGSTTMTEILRECGLGQL